MHCITILRHRGCIVTSGVVIYCCLYVTQSQKQMHLFDSKIIWWQILYVCELP